MFLKCIYSISGNDVAHILAAGWKLAFLQASLFLLPVLPYFKEKGEKS